MTRVLSIFFLSFILTANSFSAPMCHELFNEASNPNYFAEKADVELLDKPFSKDFLNEFDRQAIEIQKKLALTKQKFNHEISSWFSSLARSARVPTVTELTTLQLIIKTKDFNNIEDKTIKDMGYYLASNWAKVSGQVRTVEEIINEVLPESVLQKEPNQIQRFHLMSNKIDPKTLKLGSSSKTMTILKKVLPISLLAFAFSRLGGDAVSGALVGYMVSLASEYWNHRYLMHSGTTKEKLPWILHNSTYTMPHTLTMAQFHFNHHQVQTPKSYGPEPGGGDLNHPYVVEKVIPRLIKNGMDADRIKYYVETTNNNENYKHRETLITSLTVTPIAAILGALATHDPLVGGMMGALFSYSALLHINITHPLMHERYSKSAEKLGALKKWFLDTSYFRFVARHHFGHHVKPNTNYHALPMGYDTLLGTEYQLSNKDLIRMFENDRPF